MVVPLSIHVSFFLRVLKCLLFFKPGVAVMAVLKIDPLLDGRWPKFLERHSKTSVFHTPNWLQALHRTYGYEPLVYALTRANELTSGIVFCRIKSWFTGLRAVSLPFSDYCQPLVSESVDFIELLTVIQKDRELEDWKYIELRPTVPDRCVLEEMGFSEYDTVYTHKLDLRPDLETIFRSLHKSQVQRAILKSQKILSYEEGRSDALLEKFFRLQVLTRRKHGLPPQPLVWFRNLMDCLGDSIKIRVASKDDQPVASIITLFFKDTMVYKYGCSDSRFSRFGGMSLLFWNAIKEAKAAGASDFDFGRSDYNNKGLIAFKDHWGTSRSTLTYHRFPATRHQNSDERLLTRIAKQTFGHLPDCVLTAAGRRLYRHLG